jgi:hypothetical protein
VGVSVALDLNSLLSGLAFITSVEALRFAWFLVAQAEARATKIRFVTAFDNRL